MNLQFITQAYGAAKLALKAKAPTLMVVGGVSAMGVGTVLAAKQTLYVDSILRHHVDSLDRIQEGTELELPSYGKELQLRDRFTVYRSASVDLAKLYAVPGLLWIGGAGLVFGGHHILVKRNATLAIAFTAISEAFERYRENTREAMGHDFDQAMLTGYKRITTVDEDGKEIEVYSRDWDQTNLDPYNRVFEQGATSAWRPDLAVNRMFVSQQQSFAQQRLGQQGVLYLSDVYEALGFPESDISRVVGWKVKKLPDGSRDIPAVDFGLDKPLPDDWKYSQEKAIYLDFNCQGLIVGGKVQKILERS